jgi:hypothetical protein
MAALYRHDDLVVLVGVRVRLPRLVVGDEAEEFLEAVSGILEGGLVGWVHPRGESVDGDVGAEVHIVPDNVGQVDLGRADLHDSPIFGKSTVPDVETDGRRALSLGSCGPPSRGRNFWRNLDRLLQLGPGVIPLRLSPLRFHLIRGLQPLLELLDESNLGPDGREVLLGSGLAEEQNLLAALAGVSVLNQLVVFSANTDKDVTGCHEEELAGERV